MLINDAFPVFLEKNAKGGGVGMAQVRKISEKAKRRRIKISALIFNFIKRKQTVKSAGRISRYSTHRTCGANQDILSGNTKLDRKSPMETKSRAYREDIGTI